MAVSLLTKVVGCCPGAFRLWRGSQKWPGVVWVPMRLRSSSKLTRGRVVLEFCDVGLRRVALAVLCVVRPVRGAATVAGTEE